MRNMKRFLQKIFKNKSKMRTGLITFLVLMLVLAMTLGSARALSGTATSLPPEIAEFFSLQVRENNTKLLEVSERLALTGLAAKGIHLAGFYVDAWTCTVYVGLTKIEDDYTKPIKSIVNDVEGVNLEFFKAEFTKAELESLKRKIKEVLWADEVILKEEPFITSIRVDVKNNKLKVALRELKPQYIEAVREVAGVEAPIKFIKEELPPPLMNRTDRFRPLQGGIQLTSWDSGEGRQEASTLGFRATRSDGTVGFVMTGHSGWVGDQVWQPTSVTGNEAGRILANPRGPAVNRDSDAAFVAFTNITSTIFPGNPLNNISITGWRAVAHTPIGTLVWMEGKTSGMGTGTITHIGSLFCNIYQQVLDNQIWTNIPRAPGDSGGPVFHLHVRSFNMHDAIIYGTVTRGDANSSIYSPICNIARDLWLRWGP